MKQKIILLCYLLAVITSQAQTRVSRAQSNASQPTSQELAIVTKGYFLSKANELNVVLNSNNASEANSKWNEVDRLMIAVLGQTKSNLRKATEDNKDADKAHYIDIAKMQYFIYNELMEIKYDLNAKRLIVNEKLNQFSSTLP